MTNRLEDPKINVKIKLSILWATVMFLYLYVDVFAFYKPGNLFKPNYPDLKFQLLT